MPAILHKAYKFSAFALVAIGFLTATLPQAVYAEDIPDENIPNVVKIPAGGFIAGSDLDERDYGYRLDEKAYGHTVTRRQKWYDFERIKSIETTRAFKITETPITNAQYRAFIEETGHKPPQVDQQTWDSYGLIHPYERSLKFQWLDGKMPEDRGEHPVTMVTIADVNAYARWLSSKTGKNWRLPNELEWEKSVRGTDGRYFPWGNEFDASKLNSHDEGPFDTVPVGSFPESASPFGVLDGAGQVFEWVANSPRENSHMVKGGSWDDKGCGTCRAAASHTRPDTIKHILIGFRLVYE